MLRGALSDEIVTARELELTNMMNNNQGNTVIDGSSNSQVIQNNSNGYVIGGQANNNDLEKYKLEIGFMINDLLVFFITSTKLKM